MPWDIGTPPFGAHPLPFGLRARPRSPLPASPMWGQRPLIWLLVLVSLGSPVSAMIEAPSYAFSAFHVGLFPWRRSVPDDTLEDVSGGPQLDTVYLSPFTGPRPAMHFPPDTSVSRWSIDLLADEPYWGASAYPVWPTVSSGAMVAVPSPGALDVVCLHVTSHQVHYAICVPRICTLPWLIRVLSTSASLDIISLAIPPGLACLEAGADDALHWRSGDLIVALPPDAFTGLFQIPVFTLQAQVRHCAIWSLDFRVANRADVILWTPGPERPRLTKIPARARWSALASTFEGEFSQRYPGRWVPAPWVADDRPHLVLQPTHFDRAHVIVENGGHTFCAAVRADTDAYKLWEDLPALTSQPTILSVPMPALRAGTQVRTGDVVHVHERNAASRGSIRLYPALLIASVVAVLGRWPSLTLLALCSAHLSGALGVRTAPAEVPHRLWDPAGPLLGPEPGLPHSCPWALRRQLPAWENFDRVRPSVYAGGPEWVPRAPDRGRVTVVLVCPPAPRAVLLPASCSSAQIRDLAAALSPHAGQIAVHPTVRRVTLPGGHTVFSLRSGDVVVVRTETWVPMLRPPRAIVHATPQNAARRLPFRIQEPGMLFAWRPHEPRPLCLPTGRGELWDPSGCSFRPTLVAFSPDRWIPAQLLDPLGLHLVVASGDPDYAHLIQRGPPATVFREPRSASLEEIRDGDVALAVTPRLSCLIPLLLATPCLCAARSDGLLCVALSLGTLSAPLLFAWCQTLMWPAAGSFGLTTAQVLFSTYASAWGAPREHPEPPPIFLQDTAHMYVLLSAHFLRKPLRYDLPAFAPAPLQHAWRSFPVWQGGVPDEVFVATDGSGDGHGSWAFVAWALWHGRWYRIGWDCGSLHCTPWLLPAPGHGADTRSFLGELGALTSAAAWLTAWWDCLRVHTKSAFSKATIAVDNTSALQVAAGHASTATASAQVCRGMWQGAQSRLSTDFRHVPGHAGFAVNELADFLAGYAVHHPAAGSCAYGQFPPDFASRLCVTCSTLWLLPTATQTLSGLLWRCPCIVPGGVQDPPCGPSPSHVPDVTSEPASAPQPPPAPCTCKVVQANLQTIKDVEPSFFNKEGHGQRRIYLARQLLELDMHFALLQECRSRAGRWSSHGFLSWRSGHVKGQLGG